MTSLNAFLEVYEIDDGFPVVDTGLIARSRGDILAVMGERSFNLGSLRTFTAETSPKWDAIIARAYPEFAGIIRCVAFGWDGKIIAEVTHTKGEIDAGFAIFDPSTGESLNGADTVWVFFEEILPEDEEDLLSAANYYEWLTQTGTPAAYDECVGFDVPPFLGGPVSLKNMSITDLEVYWELTAPLIAAWRTSDDGTPIEVRVE